MWTLEYQGTLEKELKPFAKKHQQAISNVLKNLQVFQAALNEGAQPGGIRRAFVHPEPGGVIALDQKGKGKGLKQFRLYVYPDTEYNTLYVLRFGDKQSQQADLADCAVWLNEHLTEKVNASASNRENSEENGKGNENSEADR